jgi:hypothetical protein
VQIRASAAGGGLAEVHSQEAILATLDEWGALDSLPFMPEMLRYWEPGRPVG